MEALQVNKTVPTFSCAQKQKKFPTPFCAKTSYNPAYTMHLHPAGETRLVVRPSH